MTLLDVHTKYRIPLKTLASVGLTKARPKKKIGVITIIIS